MAPNGVVIKIIERNLEGFDKVREGVDEMSDERILKAQYNLKVKNIIWHSSHLYDSHSSQYCHYKYKSGGELSHDIYKTFCSL
jgi:hypothetical protein